MTPGTVVNGAIHASPALGGELERFAKEAMLFFQNGMHVIMPGNKFSSMHRTSVMGGMLLGWLSGNYLGNILAAQDLSHTPIARHSVPPPLRFMHGALEYNAYSDQPHDRMLKLMHQLAGGLVGGVAAVEGSKLFFKLSTNAYEVEKKIMTELKPEEIYLLDADRLASMAQAKFWRPITAILGSFSSSSGMALVLWLNFSTGINTAFSMMSNRKPGTHLFTMWPFNVISNTKSIYGLGPHAAVEKMAQYFSHNESPIPAEAMRYLDAIFKPVFPHITPAQEKAILDELNIIRNNVKLECAAEGRPASPKEIEARLNFWIRDLETQEINRPRGRLEQLLYKQNLNIPEAHLGDHGLLTKVAQTIDGWLGGIFGVNSTMQKVTAKYQQGFRERAFISEGKGGRLPDGSTEHVVR